MGRVKESIATLKTALDAVDKQVAFAMDCALGKEAPMKTKKKSRAVDLVTFLRGKKFPLRLGKAVHSRRETFMVDRESAKLEWNDAAGKGLPLDKRREVGDKLDELEMQLEESHNLVEQVGQGMLDLNMGIMIGIGTIYAERHKAGYEMDDTDYGVVAEFVAAQRRVETQSAMATGLMTSYHAVVRDGRDPKMIEAYVNEASKGFPTAGSATDADAKAYVGSLKRDTSGAKARYVQWTKDLHGEEMFASYAKGIDEKFAKIDQLMSTEMGAKTASSPPPSAGGGGGGAGGGGGGNGGDVNAVKNGLNAAMRGDAAGVALAAADVLPIDGRAKTAIRGAVLIAQGDFKGALGAATSLVPDGPIKKGLSILGSFL